MNIRTISLLCAIIALTAIFISTVNTTKLSIQGSTTVFATLVRPNRISIEKISDHSLNIIANGSGNGVKSVASGEAQIGMISAPLETIITKVNKSEPGAVPTKVLQAHHIGNAQVAFAIHRSNMVKELTLEQIKLILNGAVQNWKDLGGGYAPIIVATERPGGGLRSMVEQELLDSREIQANKRELPNAMLIPEYISSVPNAIGIMSTALINENIVMIKTDTPVIQPLILVTKGPPTKEARAVINAVKNIGGG